MTKNMQQTVKKEISHPSSLQANHLLQNLHSFEGQLADIITAWAGSMWFVYLHVLWYGFWITANFGLYDPFIKSFDPFPFGLLTMIVSLEAIFLATFIMISQNRHALVETFREFEEEQEQKEEEIQQEELEKDVVDIQKDLDDIKQAITFIQQKVSNVEKNKINLS
ncbi:MAG: DUF1003 domain-containing protein [Candidatus Levybacteria bacterium]|nr:DUF1003 domain-containing protein [Candidatus Levybacteria bacterium]